MSTDKFALRRELRRARARLAPGYRHAAARAVARHAARLTGCGRRIGAYLAAGTELDLEPLMSAALFRGAELYLPVIPNRARRLWFSRLGPDPDGWYVNPRYRITEFDGPVLRAEKLDVLLVPLVGVDADGYRLGQGGGFYDATLAFRRRHSHGPLVIGVAFECQRVAAVPREPWDMPLDALLTERGLFRFGQPAPHFSTHS